MSVAQETITITIDQATRTIVIGSKRIFHQIDQRDSEWSWLSSSLFLF